LTTGILLAVAILQLVTASIGLAALLVSLGHGRRLAKIDTQTNHAIQVLREVNAAQGRELSGIARQLADEKSPTIPSSP